MIKNTFSTINIVFSLIWYLCHRGNFSNDTSLELIYKQCHLDLLFSSCTAQLSKQSLVYSTSLQFCNEILSWMIEIGMKDHLVNDNKLHHCE